MSNCVWNLQVSPDDARGAGRHLASGGRARPVHQPALSRLVSFRSRAAPGKSCLHARGEKERFIVLESWEPGCCLLTLSIHSCPRSLFSHSSRSSVPILYLQLRKPGPREAGSSSGATSLLGLPAEHFLRPQGPSPGSILQSSPRDPGQEWRERRLGWRAPWGGAPAQGRPLDSPLC